MHFKSDTTAGVAPEILAALSEANSARTNSYGDDDWTQRLEARFAALFGRKVSVYLVSTGTAANAIGLAALTDPWGAVLCHREAHIETDECGAPEFFSSGAKLVLIDGAHAKITPAALQEAITRNERGVHSVLPQALSLTQCTERGTAYAPEEIDALAAIAHGAGLSVHMDGARFANAVAHLGCAPGDLVRGVDVMSFGATKNGAMAAEAIVVFSAERARGMERHRKRGGHLVSKHRYLAAQMHAFLENDLWLRLARQANAGAARLAEAAGDWLSAPVQGNQVFIKPGKEKLAALRAQGAAFYDWDAGGDEARFVVSWDQDAAEIEGLRRALMDLRNY